MSRGPLPWRLLAYLLDASPDLELIRQLVGKRLMDDRQLEQGQKDLNHMLKTLWTAGYVQLTPEPPKAVATDGGKPEEKKTKSTGLFDAFLATADEAVQQPQEESLEYRPKTAVPTPSLAKLLHLRSVNPLYGVFLVNHMGIADETERIQAFESLLEMPFSVGRAIRVPPPTELPSGPLATSRLDPRLLQLGLATAEELNAGTEDEEEESQPHGRRMFEEEKVYPLTLAEN